MARSPQALVEPSLLVWARSSARLTPGDVAARLKVPETRVLEWESGEERPSVSQLRRIAEMCRRPIAVFFLSEPPRDFDALRDFRRTKGEALAEFSDDLADELRRAQELRDAALSLLDDATEAAAFPVSATIHDDADTVAARIRAALGVSTEEQQRWKDSYRALREWRVAVEQLGVLVVNMSGVEVKEVRGFSVAHFPLPLIALNSRDTANGRTFTLMHELAHLALHEGGICEWSRELRLVPADRRVEAYCNQVAASILLPQEFVRQLVESSSLPRADEWPDEVIRVYARACSVSEEAFLRRLVSLGYATQDLYAAKRQQYLERYAEAAKKPSKAVVSYERRVVNALGAAYLDLAFSAYYARRLSLRELSSYTGVRVDNLGRVEREAFGISRLRWAE